MHTYCQNNCSQKRPPFLNIPCLYQPTFPCDCSPCCSTPQPEQPCSNSYAIYTISPFRPAAAPLFLPYVLAAGNGSGITISPDGTTITLAPGCVYSVHISVGATAAGALTMTPYINGPASPENAMTVYSPVETTPSPLSISHSFLVAVTGMPVTLRVSLNALQGTTPSEITTVSGGLSIAAVTPA